MFTFLKRVLPLVVVFSTLPVHTLMAKKSPELVAFEDSIRQAMDALPSFTLYKDNYIITGFNPFRQVNPENADALFQVSFKQRITKSTLPFNTYLFIAYTQTAAWDIYQKSAPFRNTDYNPSLVLGKNLILNNGMRGLTLFSIEHQSNGRDSIWSRSLNYLGLYGQLYLNDSWSLEARAIIPLGIGSNNTDIFNYKGFLNLGAQYITPNRKFKFSLQYNKTTQSVWSGNVIAEAYYLIYKAFDIHLFAQYYNGYAQDLLNYTEHTNYIRVGIAFSPDFFSVH